MTINYIASIGLGIRPTTYFKLMYHIPSGDPIYGILHIAVFGIN